MYRARTLVRSASLFKPSSSRARGYATETQTNTAQRAPGTIEDIFSSFHDRPPFPERFADLKRSMWNDQLVESWREVIGELEHVAERVGQLGSAAVPEIPYASLERGLTHDESQVLKDSGAFIVKGAVSQQEALEWRKELYAHIMDNRSRVKGSPAGNIVFYELYNTPTQIAARSHPKVINSQRAALMLFQAAPTTPVSLRTPISYFDRLRVRPPGPSQFVLGAHVDGGGIERWEDDGYREVYRRILAGNWQEYDPWNMDYRIDANQDLYNASNQCSIVRPIQGWLSLSPTGPGEGTLRVLPFIKASTAYMMLRPFFRPTEKAVRVASAGDGKLPLDFASWEPALDSPEFPGSVPSKAQIMTEETHPHLRLDKALVSVPKVEPGDQVLWHCDLIHAVEAEHSGQENSVVLYIPAVPYTVKNAGYLRAQQLSFEKGFPGPDFPGGVGESHCIGRGTPADVTSPEGKKAFGIEPYEASELDGATPGEKEALEQGNLILF